jgi:thiol-disulfide isomerase/thioredoxin
MTKFTFTVLIIFSFIKLCHSAQTTEILPQETPKNWIVINYWAEWCSPCRQETPELNRLSVLLTATNVKVVGINFDDLVGDELANVVKRMDIGFPQLNAQQQAVLNMPLPAALPATYIVSPMGELKLRLMGKQTLDNILAGLAKVKPDFLLEK